MYNHKINTSFYIRRKLDIIQYALNNFTVRLRTGSSSPDINTSQSNSRKLFPLAGTLMIFI